MKKLLKILMIMVICLGITACGDKKPTPAKSTDDVAKIAKDNDLKDNGFDDIGLFWTFNLGGMGFSVGFNVEDKPKYHYMDNKLSIEEVSYIEIMPNQDVGSQWIYLRPVDGEFVVDEKDIETYNDKGRKEAYAAYQEKFEELGLNAKLFGEWAIVHFNENTRTDLVKAAQKEASALLDKIKENGYNYEKDTKGRQIISSGDAYKIVIVNKQCMVLDAAFDLNVKTGYMYIPAQGTCGYSVNGATQMIYQYSGNKVLQGNPTIDQYAEMIKIKDWYDNFLNKFSAKTEILQIIK